MKRPNIFKYAKKELSQDAMVSWLIDCLHSEDAVYREIGIAFMRLLLNEDSLTDGDISIKVDGPYNQKDHMDVFAVICIRNRLYPFIFEDKTHTYLHGKQFMDYCKNVAGKMKTDKQYFSDLQHLTDSGAEGWGDIVYVYFKTGYVPGWQLDDFNRQKSRVKETMTAMGACIRFRELYLDEFIDFLTPFVNKDNLISDYRTALNEEKESRIQAINSVFIDADSCKKALDLNSEAAVSMLFQSIFGEKEWFKYNYQGWASRDLFTITDESGNVTSYCYRFEQCSFIQKSRFPAFQLQQYRYENEAVGNKDKLIALKTEEGARVQAICRRIIDENDIDCRFETLKVYPCKSYHGQMLLKFFIVDDNTPLKVCEYLKTFRRKLCDAAKEEFGASVKAYI